MPESESKMFIIIGILFLVLLFIFILISIIYTNYDEISKSKDENLLVEREMLEYSEDIYKDNNKSYLFYSDKDTDLQVGIYLTDKICVSFRGSTSVKDFMFDLNVDKMCIGQIEIHQGFYMQLFYSGIYEEFCRDLKRIINENPNHEIYITGHSLGGALATLFGYTLTNLTDRDVNVVSFASPKVGNYHWKNHFDSKNNLKHSRIIISNDFAPHFPSFDYYHCGKCKVLNTNELFFDSNYHSIRVYKYHLNL